jgi:hypothetical protein
MKVQLEHTADEIKSLRRYMNDLVSLLALPAMWSGSKPCDIVHTLLDSLLRMLDLDFVYVSLTNLVDAAPSETVRVAQSQEQRFRPRELCTFLNRWLGHDPQKRYLQERSHFGDEEASLVSWPLGVQREIGVVVAGSRRADTTGTTVNRPEARCRRTRSHRRATDRRTCCSQRSTEKRSRRTQARGGSPGGE